MTKKMLLEASSCYTGHAQVILGGRVDLQSRRVQVCTPPDAICLFCLQDGTVSPGVGFLLVSRVCARSAERA